MDAGRLKHVITIQRESETINSDGDTVTALVDVAENIRADIRSVRASERIGAGQAITSTEVLKFIVRQDARIYSDNGNDEFTKTVILHRGQKYKVVGVMPLYNVRGLELLGELIK